MEQNNIVSLVDDFDIKQELADILSQIDQIPLHFCIGGRVNLPLPGLKLKNIGPIYFPLSNSQAKEIISQCSRSPFGKYEETIVDTSIRSTWQLEPSQFTIENPEWHSLLTLNLHDHIQEKLRLRSAAISFHLYKLLIYEEGGFFLPHRDTEKEDRMFATLVIHLPSRYSGGELVVRHRNEEEIFDFAKDSDHFYHFSCFYADCEHEVKPVLSGYRFCLVYNVVYEGNATIPQVPGQTPLELVIKSMMDWKKLKSPSKLVLPLEHKYTKSSLSFESLKNGDASKVEVLKNACRETGTYFYLAFLTINSSAEFEDNLDDPSVYSTDYYLSDWKTEGTEIDLGRMEVFPKNELLVSSLLDNMKPDRVSTSVTGNEGSSREKWYYHTAVVFWPEENDIDVMSESCSDLLLYVFHRLRSFPQQKTLQESESWNKYISVFQNYLSKIYLTYEKNELLPILEIANDPKLFTLFLEKEKYLQHCWSADSRYKLGLLCWKYGWELFASKLHHFLHKQFALAISLIHDMIPIIEPQLLEPEQRNKLMPIMELVEQTVLAKITHKLSDLAPSYSWNKNREIKILLNLLRTTFNLSMSNLFETLIDTIIGRPKIFYPLQVAANISICLLGWGKEKILNYPPFEKLLNYAISQLETRANQVIEEPKDWNLNVKLKCHCSDCKSMEQFLNNPHEKCWEIKAGHQRMRHMEDSGDKIHDIKFERRTQCAPYKLYCEKNRKSYEAESEHLQFCQKSLEWVKETISKIHEKEENDIEPAPKKPRNALIEFYELQ